jgi:hypothetical protein
MTTSQEIRDQAPFLAGEGMDPKDEATLMLGNGSRRVPVVSAKRTLEVELAEQGGGTTTARALEIVNTMLTEGNWAE